MTQLPPLAEICQHRLLPVITIEEAALASTLGAVLSDAGFPIAEITLRTPAALDAIAILARNPDFTVGAGTVLTSADVDRAVDAGARFVVSPGFSPAVVARCAERGVPHLPGVASPSEVMAAAAAGLHTAKLFPVSTLGGLAAIRALAGPFPTMRFVPLGGVTAANAGEYLEHPAVEAVGGSWLAPPDLLHARDWGEVARRCSAFAHIRDRSTVAP
jgi:2-dehydro-3-deoxyphosphogluconate aldolase/(4S)-4-hydroxy-2-oxoglutarate aldolase